MASYLSWAANTALIATGCFVTASMANGILGEWVAPAIVAEDLQERVDAGDEPGSRSPSAIVARNLFRSALQPKDSNGETPVANDEGPLEETALALRLLGTVASDDPTVARAALEDTELRQRLVVRVGDRVKEKATVYRIERRRIVLAENDGMRELSLDDEPPLLTAPMARRRAALNRRRSSPPRGPKVTRETVQETLRDPSTLFQQARFLPKYEDGQMQGYQISGIKPGSLVEEMGLSDGDVIVGANGVAIDSPTAGGQLFRQINEVDELTFTEEKPDGSTEEIQVPLDD